LRIHRRNKELEVTIQCQSLDHVTLRKASQGARGLLVHRALASVTGSGGTRRWCRGRGYGEASVARSPIARVVSSRCRVHFAMLLHSQSQLSRSHIHTSKNGSGSSVWLLEALLLSCAFAFGFGTNNSLKLEPEQH